MSRHRLAVFVCCLALLALGTPARADDDKDRRSEPFVARVFKLEHQSAESVARAVRHLLSTKDAKLDADETLDTVTVRDRSASVTAIEQAIKQLDVPRPDVAFQV